jgi:hypothetical protein
VQGLGDANRAVGLLIVFEDCEPGAAHSQPAAIEGVDKLGFSLASARTEPDVGTPRLKGVEVRAGGDFPVEPLAWEPDFEIVGLGGRKACVPGAEQNPTIRQFQSFKNLFCVAGELFVLGVGFFGARELDQLDFLKLVLANDAARVLARRASLGAEARRISRERDGQAGLVEDFVAVEIGYRNFRQ